VIWPEQRDFKASGWIGHDLMYGEDAETRKWVRNNGVGSAKVGAILQQH